MSQRVVPIFEHIARAAAHPLSAGARVLDFGAGAGRHVAEFRSHGYDAWGIDQSFTSHVPGSVSVDYLRWVQPPDYTLPFAANEFDFVYSTAVMEHVTDPGRALTEIARVLRPDGLSIHVFPSRWRPIEPHMFVPLGGRFQSFAYFRFWARLGVRNTWQEHLSSTEIALRNVQFCKTGASYPTAAEWTLRASRVFDSVTWAEREFIEGSAAVSTVSRLIARYGPHPILTWLYRGMHTRVLVLQHPRA